MLGGITITRVWMARPFQTRSRHWDIDGSQCTEVAKEGWNAPGWITEQGKTLALGSGRISCQNPEVVPLSYKLQLEHLANTLLFYHSNHSIYTSHTVLDTPHLAPFLTSSCSPHALLFSLQRPSTKSSHAHGGCW